MYDLSVKINYEISLSVYQIELSFGWERAPVGLHRIQYRGKTRELFSTKNQLKVLSAGLKREPAQKRLEE